MKPDVSHKLAFLNFLIPMLMAVFVMSLMLTSPASAHKLFIFAYVEGDSVIVDGYFSGGVKAQDSAVLVYDSEGKKLIEGKTDAKGVYSFKLKDLPPSKGGLKIAIEAEMGHKGEYSLSAADLGQAKEKSASQDVQPVAVNATENMPETVHSAPQSVDQDALIAGIGSLLDKKLAPLIRMQGSLEKLLLEEKFSGPKMSDIIGGIGWILGLCGIAAFFLSFKRSSKK